VQLRLEKKELSYEFGVQTLIFNTRVEVKELSSLFMQVSVYLKVQLDDMIKKKKNWSESCKRLKKRTLTSYHWSKAID